MVYLGDHNGRMLLLVCLLLLLQLSLSVNFTYSRIPLINEYVRTHNANYTLSSSPDLCSRRYLISAINCRSSVGNEFMMFLNNLALGVVTNRTLLVHIDEASCDNKVVFAPWLPRFEKVIGLLAKQCNITTFLDLNFIDEEKDSASPITLACCDIDTAHNDSPLLKYNRVDRMQASTLIYQGAHVSNATARNAREIFAIPGKGPLYGYGQLFHSTIKFAKTVTHWNEHFLLQLKQLNNATAHNVTVLGAHLRHQLVEDQGKLQGYEALRTLDCMKKLLPSTRRDYCVIILATDRSHTLMEVERWAKSREIMCQFMHSASSHEGEEKDFGWGGAKKSKNSVREEHGPWGDGLLVFTDMHLLSQATAFVGSKGYSTYASSLSILYGAIIAGKHSNSQLQLFPPSCTSLSFNGEIFNGSLLHTPDGKMPKSASLPPAVEDEESTWHRMLKGGSSSSSGSKKGELSAVQQHHHISIYEKYVVDKPVINCTEQILKERCTYNLGRI